jgi:predicted transcriptional regulator
MAKTRRELITQKLTEMASAMEASDAAPKTDLLCTLLVDAVLSQDEVVYDAVDELQRMFATARTDAQKATLLVLFNVFNWAGRRMNPRTIPGGPLGHTVLKSLHHAGARGMTITRISEAAENDTEALRSVLRTYVAQGYVTKRRFGEEPSWMITPRGREVLGQIVAQRAIAAAGLAATEGQRGTQLG